MRVLLVEDDQGLAQAIIAGLSAKQFVVDHLELGRHAKHALDHNHIDVVVLDLGLPDINGLDVLEHWRAHDLQTPVLILTARQDVPDRIRGLNSGADDYMIKPFDLDELAARLHALARRAVGRSNPVISLGSLTINPQTRQVEHAGNALALSAKELQTLIVLANHVDRVITREQLSEKVYGWGSTVESNALEVHVHHLRRKLGQGWIHTVRGVGYMLKVPDES